MNVSTDMKMDKWMSEHTDSCMDIDIPTSIYLPNKPNHMAVTNTYLCKSVYLKLLFLHLKELQNVFGTL